MYLEYVKKISQGGAPIS